MFFSYSTVLHAALFYLYSFRLIFFCLSVERVRAAELDGDVNQGVFSCQSNTFSNCLSCSFNWKCARWKPPRAVTDSHGTRKYTLPESALFMSGECSIIDTSFCMKEHYYQCFTRLFFDDSVVYKKPPLLPNGSVGVRELPGHLFCIPCQEKVTPSINLLLWISGFSQMNPPGDNCAAVGTVIARRWSSGNENRKQSCVK